MTEPAKVTDERPFSAKDLIVALPLCASTIAITWEVGSFAPISVKVFGLFSITEHIGFALQAFPLAILAACYATVMLLFVKSSSTYFWPRTSENVQKRTHAALPPLTRMPTRQKVFSRIAVTIVGTLTFMSLSYFTGVFLFLATGLGILLFGVPFAFGLQAFSNEKYATWLMAMCFGLFVTLSLGADVTNWGFASARAGKNIVKLDTTAGVLDAFIVRVGERGVLIYQPQDTKISFVRWDQVKRLELPYLLPKERMQNSLR